MQQFYLQKGKKNDRKRCSVRFPLPSLKVHPIVNVSLYTYLYMSSGMLWSCRENVYTMY